MTSETAANTAAQQVQSYAHSAKRCTAFTREKSIHTKNSQ